MRDKTTRRTFLLLLLLLPALAWGGIVCDGDDDLLTAGDLFDLPDATFTFEAWIQTTGTASFQYLMSKWSSAAGYYIRVISGGTLSVNIVNTAGDGIANRVSTADINDGLWHHLAIVFTTNTTVRDSNSITIYVDGVLSQGTLNHAGTGGYASNAIAWQLCTVTTLQLAATLGSAAMYQGAMTAEQAAQRHASRMKFPGIPRDLHAYWPLESCSHGTAATDGTAFPARGTTTAATLTSDNGAGNTGMTCQGDTFLMSQGVW